MRVAYLVNQYPKTSHSFIRREIRGVESSGVDVERFSIRKVDEPLVDPADVEEEGKTRVLLDRGARTVVLELVLALFRHPFALIAAFRAALGLAQNSQRGIAYHIAYIAEACRLRRWCKQSKVDHVHAHFGTNATAVATLCRALGGPPFSFTVHSPGSSEVPELCALAKKMRHAQFVCAVSQHGKSQLLRHSSPSSWSNIHLVHCGTDESFLENEIVTPPTARQLVCVARMSAEKGHIVLFHALGKLAEEGVRFDLSLVGDGPLRSSLEELARDLNIEQHVHFLGWKSGDEVRAAILAARALVLPSFVEGLPVVVMEAFALHRPVIATWVGGVPELVLPSQNGWLVPAGSVDDLAEACRAALDATTDELAELGKHGAERVATQHDAQSESKRLAQLFQSHTRTEAA